MDGRVRSGRLTEVHCADYLYRAWTSNGLSDSDLKYLQAAVLNGPNCDPVLSGTGGLRKIRFGRQGEARVKSGSYSSVRSTRCVSYEQYPVGSGVQGRGSGVMMSRPLCRARSNSRFERIIRTSAQSNGCDLMFEAQLIVADGEVRPVLDRRLRE
jgi:hypothetical protein